MRRPEGRKTREVTVMKDWFNRTIASVLILVNVAAMLPAREFDVGKQAGMTRLEHSLDRAAKERNPESWQRIAEEGLTLAVTEWENRTLSMKESDPATWQKEKDFVTGEYKAVAGKEYASWLGDRFFEERAQAQTGKMARELEEKAAAWNYAGADGTSTRVVAASDAASAREQWRSTVSAGVIDAYLESWESGSGADYPEIASYLSDAGLSYADIGGLVAEKKESYTAYVRSEYERVAAVEENGLMMSLLYDQNSLKKKSAEEAAKIIAARIAGEAKEETTADIDRLFSLMEGEIESQKADGVEIDTDAWLASFRASFEKNLAKWDDAEKEFLVARADWEKDANKVYLDSEQVWANAYAELKSEQKKWQKEIEARFDTGIQKWAAEESALTATIRAAREEFTAATKQEQSKTEQVIDLQVSVYNQSREMLSMAMEGMNSWYERWGEKYDGVYSYWKTEPVSERFAHGLMEGVTVTAKGDLYTANLKNTDTAERRTQFAEWKRAALAMLQSKLDVECGKIKTEKISIDFRVKIANTRVDNGKAFIAIYESNEFIRTQFPKADYDKAVAQLPSDEAELAALISRKNLLDGITDIERYSSLFSGMNADSASGGAIDSAIQTAVSSFGLPDTLFSAIGAAWNAAGTMEDWLNLVDAYKVNTDNAIKNLYAATGGATAIDYGDEYYDELDVELLKARAVAKYCRDELDIAQAVDDYATTVTSGAEWSDETKFALKVSKDNYQAALNSYNETIEKLDSLYAVCADKGEALKSSREAIAREDASVEEARSKYGMALLAAKGAGGTAIKQKMQGLIESLNKTWSSTDEKVSSSILAYYRSAQAYAQVETEKSANELIKQLVNGSAEVAGSSAKIESLETLRGYRDDAAKRVNSTPYEQQFYLASMPSMYATLQNELSKRYAVYVDPSASIGERNIAAAMLTDGWKIVKAYWDSQIAEREAAVRYFITGETGLEGMMGDAATQGADRVKAWLTVQKKLLPLQLAALKKVDAPAVGAGSVEKDAYTAYCTERDYLESSIATVNRLLSVDAVTRSTLLSTLRSTDRFVASLAGMSCPFDSVASGWANELLELELAGTTFSAARTHDSIVNRYKDYAYTVINSRNSTARIDVAKLIEKKAKPEAENGDNYNYLEKLNLDSLILYLDDLQSEGAGLTAAGKEELQNYIAGVIEYVACHDVYTGKTGVTDSSIALLSAYNTKSAGATECASWANTVYQYDRLLDVAGSPTFKNVASTELKARFADYMASFIIEKLSLADLCACSTREDVIALIASDMYSDSVDSDRLLALDSAITNGIADRVLEVFRSPDAETVRLDLYASWLKLAPGDPEKSASRYLGDAQIKRYADAKVLLPEANAYRENKATITAHRNLLYLRSVIESGVTGTLASGAGLDSLESLAKWYNDRVDAYNAYVKTYNMDPQNGDDLESVSHVDVTGFIRTALESYYAGIPASMADGAINVANVLVAAIEDLEATMSPLLSHYAAMDQDVPSYALDENACADAARTDAADTEKKLIDAEKQSLADFASANGYDAVYADLLAIDESLWDESTLTYELAGADLLYVYLLSPDGQNDVGRLLPALKEKNPAESAEVREYHDVSQAVASWSSLLDGPLDIWLEKYTTFEGRSLSESEKARVREAISLGIADTRTAYSRTEFLRQYKPLAVPSGPRLALMQECARNALAAAFDSTAKDESALAQKVLYKYQYAVSAEDERKSNRSSWIADVVKDGIATSEAIKDSPLSRMKKVIDLHAAYFSATTDEPILTFSRVAAADLPSLLGKTWEIAVSDDTECDRMEKARWEFRALAGADRQNLTDICKLIPVYRDCTRDKDKLAEVAESYRVALENAGERYADAQVKYGTAVIDLLQSYDSYNVQLAAVQTAFDGAEKTKIEQSKKQRIFDWASSVYLKNMGEATEADYATPKEKLAAARYALSRADVAVKVLERLSESGRGATDGGYDAAFDRYRAACENYYLSRAVQYESNREIARMENAVRKAQESESAALAAVVGNTADELPDELIERLDLVRLAFDGTSYTPVLAYDITVTPSNLGGIAFNKYGLKSRMDIAANDKITLTKYFTDKTVEVKTLDGKVMKTQAETEALGWLEKINQKSDAKGYLADLGLALLYIKLAAVWENPAKSCLFDSGANPGDNASYGLENADRNLHGIDVAAFYNEARYAIVRDAYERITSTDAGKGDLAHYILFRDGNFRSTNFATLEKRELEVRATDMVQREIGSAISDHTGIANAAMVTGTLLLGIPWGWIPAALCFIVAGTQYDAANSLYAVRSNVLSLNSKRTSDRDRIYSDTSTAFADWLAARDDLATKQDQLERYYGKTGGTIGYDALMASLDEMLQTTSGPVSSSLCRSVYTRTAFDSSGAGDSASTMESVDKLNRYLGQLSAEAKTSLEESNVKRLMNGQTTTIAEFEAKQTESCQLTSAESAGLKALAIQANDVSLSIAERAAASAEYDRLSQRFTSASSLSKAESELESLAKKAFGTGSWRQRDSDAAILALEKSLATKYTSNDRETEPYTQATIDDLKAAALLSVKNAQDSRLAVREAEWTLALQRFKAEKDEWYGQIALILQISNAEWAKAEGKINAGYKDWQTEFRRSYENRAALWQSNYDSFLTGKQSWITDQYLYATNAANGKVIAQSGLDVESAISKTMKDTLAGNRSMLDAAFDSTGYVATLLGATKLASLMDCAASIQDRATGSAAVIRRGAALDAKGVSSIASATQAIEAMNAVMKKAGSQIAADQANTQFQLIQKQYVKRLEAENKSMADWETSLVLGSGYGIGSEISRSAIVDSTVGNVIRKKQTVHKYEDYQAASAKISVSLDDGNIAGLDSTGIMLLIEQANVDLKAYGEDIFGKTDKKGVTKEWKIPRTKQEAAATEYAKIEEDKETQAMVMAFEETQKQNLDTLSDDDKKKYTETMNSMLTIRDGKFGQHTGFAPLFKSGENLKLAKMRENNLEYRGKGEIGAIMLDFQWNSMQQGKGYDELAKPMYDKRLWDDTDSAIKAPTVRGIADIAIAIAIGAVTGGAGTGIFALLSGSIASALGNLVDDFVFAGLDLTGGYKTGEQVGNDLARKAITSAVSVGTSVGGSALGTLIPAEGVGKVLGDIGIAGAKSATNTVTGAFVNNMDFTKLGTASWFDADSFANSMTNPTAWASTVASMAGAGVTSGLGEINLRDGNKNWLTEKVFDTKSLHAMNGLAGGMMNSAVTYAMTGNAKFNVANFMGTGLVELNLGNDGFSMNLGMDGTDVSAGTIAGALRGFKEADRIVNAKNANANGDDRMLSTINSINVLGSINNAFDTQLARDIWSGKLKAKFGDTQGDYGLFDTTKPGEITLSNELRGMGNEKAAKLAAVMAHEGTHAAGNRYEGVAHEAGLETYSEIVSKFKLSGDSSFANEMVQGINDKNSWVENTGDVDHWRLMENGSLLFDGQKDLFDSNGNLIRKVKAGGVESGLAKLLDIPIEKAHKLMEAAGMKHDTTKKELWDSQDKVSLFGTSSLSYNLGKSIQLGKLYNVNDVNYDSIYTSKLAKDNTKNVYDRLVSEGRMETNKNYDSNMNSWWAKGLSAVGLGGIASTLAGGKYISYEEYKANNFITGNPSLSTQDPLANFAAQIQITGAFGSIGSYGVHTGVDLGIDGKRFASLFSGNTTVGSQQGSATDQTGFYRETTTTASYTFKGEQVKDTITTKYDHLTNGADSVASTMLVGKSGDTGQTKSGEFYKAHLHIGITTSGAPSALLNLYQMQYLQSGGATNPSASTQTQWNSYSNKPELRKWDNDTLYNKSSGAYYYNAAVFLEKFNQHYTYGSKAWNYSK
jgi:hypothetical protein